MREYSGGIFGSNVLGAIDRGGMGQIDPTGKDWNTPVYQACMGQYLADVCGDVLPGLPQSLCVEKVQDQCIKKAQEALAAGGGSAPSSSSYPWGKYSDATKALQQQLNTKLVALGYKPIDVDGKLGKGTCGAAREVWPEMEPNTCQGWTKPTKASGGLAPPVKSTTTDVVTPPTNRSNALLIGGLIAAGAVGLYFAMRKR